MIRSAMALLMLCAVLLPPSHASAQSLDDQLDEDRFLRGLAELNLPEVLERYLQLYPPADAITAAEHQLALQRLQARQSDLSIEQRDVQVMKLLDARERLLREHADSPRRAKWLADQAADVYFELLPLDAAGVMTIFGMPSEAQHQRAQRAARLMYDYAQRAERALDEAILDLESHPDFAQSISLQLQRRRMAEDERDRRIPFLYSIASYLHSSVTSHDASQQQQMLVIARSLLEPTITRLHEPLNQHALLYLALIHHQLGERDTARMRFKELLDTEPADPLLAASAGIGHALTSHSVMGELNQLARRYHRADDLFLRLLIADAQFRHLRDRSLNDAIGAYTSLLDEDLGHSPQQMRDVVFARLVRAIDADMPLDQLPRMAQIARASQMVQHHAADDAIAVLETILESRSLSQQERGLALLTLGRGHHAAGDGLAAATQFIALAREFPTSADAPRAIEWAATLASEAHRTQPHQAEPILEQALRVLLQQHGGLADIDRWRLAAGQLALQQRRFSDALEHFESVAANTPYTHNAAYMQARTLVLAARQARDRGAERNALERAAQRIEQVRVVLDASTEQPQLQALLQILDAEIHLRRGQPQQAIERLDTIDDPSALPGRAMAEAMQLRIESYRALGEIESAQQAIDQFMAAAPQRVPQVLLPWMASLAQDVAALIEQHEPQQSLELAQRELEPLAARLQQWLAETSASAEQKLAILPRIAEAYRLSGNHQQALPLYEELLADRPNAAELLFGQAECLFHLASGSNEETTLGQAITIYRRISAAGISVGEDVYWQSHLRSLQILDRMERNTHQIVPQIQRLRQQDRTLGGEHLRRAFEQLYNKYAS